MRVVAETLHLCDDPLAEAATDIDVLRKVLWQKFYFGADSLLDMMVQIQEQIKAETDQNFKVKAAASVQHILQSSFYYEDGVFVVPLSAVV